MLGHNNPPEDFARVNDLVATADRWKAERPVIETDDVAEKAQAFLDQLRSCAKDIEKARKADKQPHMDAAKAVDELYKPQVDRLTAAANIIKGLLTDFLRKKEDERRRVEEERRRAAEEARRKAEEASREAASVDQQVAAQKARGDAEAAAKVAEQTAKSRAQVTGQGRTVSLRTRRVAVIVDQGKVYRKFRDHPSVIEALQKLVNAEVRAGKSVPGVEVREEQAAA